MAETAITEDGMVGNAVNSQTEEDELARQRIERQQENQKGFLKGWRVHP